MSGRPDELTPRIRRVVAAAVIAAVSLAARAADQPRSAGGGLVPTPRKTREELVREWDLNSDGTIDAGEVEVASSRMRRERAHLRLNSGIDPVTGLPRGEAANVPDPGDLDVAVEPSVPDEEPVEEPDRDERPALPGTRVPRPTLPGTGRTKADPQADAPRNGAAAGTRAAADLKRQSLTGGVKAGGLPARAGYGTGMPATPLNAGLPVPPKPRATATPAAPPRGGLVPGPRQPAPAPRQPARSRDMYDPY